MPTRRFRSSRTARFAGFELDLRAGELRREGARVRLQEQPFRILAMLLEHPGEVVLRDEIRKRLWPNDTVVEIGHGINAAVLRLREALGESAESPRFIETLPRRGYRFNGTVEWETGPPLTIAGDSSTGPPAPPETTLTGQTVSHYRVLEKLGSGGMGVVYRAEDLQLGRHVALKFLSREFAQDPSARDRFQKEARAASALNHPNVCTVYTVEECAGQPVISMELVEGDTLSARLAGGAMPASLVLQLALQVAGALEAAHRKGVVHRDLKPGNLMVTGPMERPCVKVLDFGIAKMERSPALGLVTQDGDVMGTPHYMSPEQVQGRETDARSDIFSFGLVLYEMLTGRRPTGDRRALAAALPPGWEPVVSCCLADDPRQRWQTAGELKAELERLARPLPQPTQSRRLRLVSIVAAAVFCTGLLIAKLPILPVRLFTPQPVFSTLVGPLESKAIRVKLSPDGRSVAFLTGTRHYVRALNGGEPKQLLAPDGVGTPFWSPDGRSVALADGSQLIRVGLAPGSAPSSLARVNTNLEGAWGRDGTILIGLVNDGIYRIPAAGGTLTRVTVPDAMRGETRHFSPQFLPGGRRFLYLAGNGKPNGSMLCAASLDSPERSEVMPMQSNFSFVPFSPGATQGYLLYLRERILVAQAFDSARLVPIGEPYALAPPVNSNPLIGTTAITGEFSATPATLLYRTGTTVTVVQNWMSEVGRTSKRNGLEPW